MERLQDAATRKLTIKKLQNKNQKSSNQAGFFKSAVVHFW